MQQRLDNGAALFNRPELKIRVVDGEVTAKVSKRNSASRFLVSEFMILANSIAARFCARHDIPIIYRVQDKPEGLPELDPEHYDPILFDKAIKCMKKSRLSLYPGEHGGLGVDFYTQLTSPVRRYTDLIMQRQLAAKLTETPLPYEGDELMQIIANADVANSEVREVQNQADSFWLHEYIRLNLQGQEETATVVNKLTGGWLVELDTLCNRTRLNCPEKFTAGDRIRVEIEKVKPEKGFIRLRFLGKE